MKDFPENLELLEFFEAEPILSDPELPWAYNRLQFSTKLGEERVDCIVDNSRLEVRWFRHEVEQVYLALYPVQSLKIQEYPNGNAFIAEGVGPSQDSTLRLQLRPRVHLALESSQ